MRTDGARADADTDHGLKAELCAECTLLCSAATRRPISEQEARDRRVLGALWELDVVVCHRARRVDKMPAEVYQDERRRCCV